MILRWLCIVLAAVLASTSCARTASAECTELQSLKAGVYGFNPAEVGEEQRAAKSKDLDRFWDAAIGKPETAAPCLREMLAREKEDGFFLFNASMLLFRIDQSQASLDSILDAVLRSDLDQVDPAGYLEFVVGLAQRGANTGKLAAKYLLHPEVDAYVPLHALKVDRKLGAFFLYGSMDVATAERLLVDLLASEDREAREAAALVLAHLMTEGSFRALKEAVPQDMPEGVRNTIEGILKLDRTEWGGQPKFSREEVLRLILTDPDDAGEELLSGDDPEGAYREFMRSAILTLTEEDLPELRNSRRRSMRRISDEALHEFFDQSRVLLAVINRLDLYSEFRRP